MLGVSGNISSMKECQSEKEIWFDSVLVKVMVLRGIDSSLFDRENTYEEYIFTYIYIYLDINKHMYMFVCREK